MGDALENLTWSPDVEIKNTFFGSCRARGLLVTTPGKVVIENNIFESSGSAILIAGDANGLSADPLFVYPAARDLRVMAASPVVDSAVDVGRDVNGPGPGRFFGGAPDRGAGEAL